MKFLGCLQFVLLFIIGIFAGFYLDRIAVDISLDLLLLSLASYLFFLYISIYIHEFGHALAGWLVGFPIKKITIGMGKNIWKGQIHRTATKLVINRGFEGGLTNIGDVSEQDWIRIRYFVYVLGGVGIQSLLVWLGWQIQQPYMFFDWPLVPKLLLDSFVLANVSLIVGNLMPLQVTMLGVPMATDGLQLLKVFFMRESEIAEFLIAGKAVDGMENLQDKNFTAAEENFRECLDRAPKSVLCQINLSVALIKQQRIDDAIAVLQEVLNHAPKKIQLAIIYNNLAWFYLLKATTDRLYLEQADDYSSRAIAIHNSIPYLLGTRGCVLVEMGRIEEGIKTLKKITKLNQPINERTNSVMGFVYLAYGYYRQNDWSNAVKYWQKFPDNEDLNSGDYAILYEHILNQTDGFQKLSIHVK